MRRSSNLMIVFAVLFFLVGAAIVFIVVNDDDDDSASLDSGERSTTVVIPTEEVPAGTIGADLLAAGTLTTEQVPLADAPADAITSVGELQNAIFAVSVDADTVITRSAIATRSVADVEIPEGFEAVAVQVDFVAGGARYVGIGDRVNLYGVMAPCVEDADTPCPPYETPRVDLILTNVQVLDVDRQDATAVAQTTATTEPSTGGTTITRQTSATPVTFLLALKTTDAERAIFYTSFANLYISKVGDGAPPAPETPGVQYDNTVDPRSADSAAG